MLNVTLTFHFLSMSLPIISVSDFGESATRTDKNIDGILKCYITY